MRHAKRRRVGPWKGAAFVALLALALVRPALAAKDGKPNILDHRLRAWAAGIEAHSRREMNSAISKGAEAS